MNIDPVDFGRLMQSIMDTKEVVLRLDCKLDNVCDFQARTEERLKSGNKKFEGIEKHLENTDANVIKTENRIDLLEKAPAKNVSRRLTAAWVIIGGILTIEIVALINVVIKKILA